MCKIARLPAYLRVSSSQQGKSGLGLEAQRKVIMRFAGTEGLHIAGEFFEVETGRVSDAVDRRPQLAAALAAAKLAGGAVCVAKLDRLSRDVAFIAGLVAQKMPFVVAEQTPSCCIYTRRWPRRNAASSARTRDALRAARERGVPLGGWRGGPVVDQRLGTEAVRRAADTFAASLAPTVCPMRQDGKSLRAIADALQAKGIKTARGGAWTPTAVRNVLARLPAA